MEIKKTTMLSALVCITGVLAEIIFHDSMARTVSGVALSVALGVVVIISFYFVFDGFFCMLQSENKRAQKTQKEFEQSLYAILNDQLKFEKAIYKEVNELSQSTQEKTQKALSEAENSLEPIDYQKLVEEINGNTLKAAKIVVKYVSKNTTDIKTAIFALQKELPQKE